MPHRRGSQQCEHEEHREHNPHAGRPELPAAPCEMLSDVTLVSRCLKPMIFSHHGCGVPSKRSKRITSAFSPGGPTNPPVNLSMTMPSAPINTVVGSPGTAYASIILSSTERTAG